MSSVVFFDITIGGTPAGKLIFRLYDEYTPKTAMNFKCLCTGEKGIGKTTKKLLHYKGSIFHRIIPGFMLQGGDFSNRNGTGGESIFGGKFDDESFRMKHTKMGQLSMANAGPNTNGSQFFITLGATPHLDGKHVVFGELISGMETVKQMEGVETVRDAPIKLEEVMIVDCGEYIPPGPASVLTAKRKDDRFKDDDDEDDTRHAKNKKAKKDKSEKKAKKEAKRAKKEQKKEQKKREKKDSKKSKKKRSKSEESDSSSESSSDDDEDRDREQEKKKEKKEKKEEKEKDEEEDVQASETNRDDRDNDKDHADGDDDRKKSAPRNTTFVDADGTVVRGRGVMKYSGQSSWSSNNRGGGRYYGGGRDDGRRDNWNNQRDQRDRYRGDERRYDRRDDRRRSRSRSRDRDFDDDRRGGGGGGGGYDRRRNSSRRSNSRDSRDRRSNDDDDREDRGRNREGFTSRSRRNADANTGHDNDNDVKDKEVAMDEGVADAEGGYMSKSRRERGKDPVKTDDDTKVVIEEANDDDDSNSNGVKKIDWKPPPRVEESDEDIDRYFET